MTGLDQIFSVIRFRLGRYSRQVIPERLWLCKIDFHLLAVPKGRRHRELRPLVVRSCVREVVALLRRPKLSITVKTDLLAHMVGQWLRIWRRLSSL